MRILNCIFTIITSILILCVLILLFPILLNKASFIEYFSANNSLKITFISILANLTLAFMIFYATKRTFDLENKIWFDIFLRDKNLMIKSLSKQGIYLYKYKLELKHAPDNAHVRNNGEANQNHEQSFSVPIHLPGVMNENSDERIFEIDLLRDRSRDEKDEKISRISIYHSYSYSVGDEYTLKLILYLKTYDHEKRKIIIEGTTNINSDCKLEFSELKIPKLK